MQPITPLLWGQSETDALKIQQELIANVITTDHLPDIQRIAGVDVAFRKTDKKPVAVINVVDADSLDTLETVSAEAFEQFHPTPELISFRELPALIQAFATLEHNPDLVIFNGIGIAHAKGFGPATQLGVLFDLPIIGCTKQLSIGDSKEPGILRGASSDVVVKNEIVGKYLRTKTAEKPVFVSVGHRVSLDTACEWILKLTEKHRLPETLRRADLALRKATLP